MDGMQMMMKALGVDPAAIMQAAGTFQEGLKKVMDDLETIKRNQEEILHHLKLERIDRTNVVTVPAIVCDTRGAQANG